MSGMNNEIRNGDFSFCPRAIWLKCGGCDGGRGREEPDWIVNIHNLVRKC
jgi:hypothetical protein